MVGMERLELSHRRRQILGLMRLPIPPHSLIYNLSTVDLLSLYPQYFLTATHELSRIYIGRDTIILDLGQLRLHSYLE